MEVAATGYVSEAEPALGTEVDEARKAAKSTAYRFALAIAILIFLLSGQARAQKEVYADYPKATGDVQDYILSGLPRWLIFQFQLRGRTEGQTAFDYTTGSGQVYELTRAYGSVEVDPTSWFTLYAQFIDTHALGLPLPLVQSNMRDVFDLRQGFLEVHPRIARVPVSLYAGRFELKFGNERVVGISDWTNNSRTWDGFKADIGAKEDFVTLFSTSVVTVHPSSLDNHGAGLTFDGAYAELRTLAPKTDFEPFVLVRAVRGVTSQQGLKGNEVETTFGTEVEGDLAHGFTYDVMGDLQRGSYSNDSIQAGAGIVNLNYERDTARWKPRLGGEFHYATGNTHREPDRISTYDQQYPSNHNHFGLTDLFGFENIREERMNLDLAPHKNVTVLIQGEFLNVPSRADDVYASAGGVQFKPPAGAFAHDDIGQEIDASGAYTFKQYWLAQMGVGHLFAGRLLAEAGHPEPETLGYFSLTYKFKLSRQ